MNEQISRLVDGEIDAAELDAVCAMLKGEAGMATWSCYHTIGDALRGETAVTRSVRSAVARQLDRITVGPRRLMLVAEFRRPVLVGALPFAGHGHH